MNVPFCKIKKRSRLLKPYCALTSLTILAGCAKTTSSPPDCDFTKMAYQSPTFVDQYLGARQHSDWTQSVSNDHIEERHFEYSGDLKNDTPYIGVTFINNKAVELEAFFFRQQTPAETAHRVGLRLSDFQPVSRTNSLLTVKGKAQGVHFQALIFTNLDNQTVGPQKTGSWNIIAYLAKKAPGKTK